MTENFSTTRKKRTQPQSNSKKPFQNRYPVDPHMEKGPPDRYMQSKPNKSTSKERSSSKVIANQCNREENMAVNDLDQAEEFASMNEVLDAPADECFTSEIESSADHDDYYFEAMKAKDSQKDDIKSELTIKMSQSLIKKISHQAIDEGLTTEEYVAELLTEGVVVRAWEIIERKNQMRGQQPSSSGQINNRNGGGNGNGYQYNRNNGNSGNNNNNQRNKIHQRGGMSHTRYQSIMDDKATFLEYVRQQERNRR